MRKALVFFALAVPAWLRAQPGTTPGLLVFTHVTVIDCTGAPEQPDMTVVITGDRISAIGKSAGVAIPRAARVIDAPGKFLIPGLWDMHGHLTDATETAFP